MKFHQIDKSFDIKTTSFRGIEPLIEGIADRGGVELRRNEHNHLEVRIAL